MSAPIIRVRRATVVLQLGAIPAGDGGGGTSNHAALTNLPWVDAAHTGPAYALAAWDDGAGAYALPATELAHDLLVCSTPEAMRATLGAEVAGAAAAAVAAIPSDGAAGTASLRTLGTGSQQAAAGDDARLLAKWAPYSLVLSGQQTWMNLPAASTELFGGTVYRPILDFTRCSEIALFVRRGAGVAVAGMVFDLEYTADLTGATGWTALGMALATPAASTFYHSLGSPTALPAGAKNIRLWRAVASGGDGVLDPTIFSVVMYVR